MACPSVTRAARSSESSDASNVRISSPSSVRSFWCGPWPCWRAAPRFSRFTQHDVGVEPVMAVKASPRKYEIQPVSLCERVDALQTCQRSVGTKVQAKVRSRGGARRMSAFGTKRTSELDSLMSAFGGKADNNLRMVQTYFTLGYSIGRRNLSYAALVEAKRSIIIP
jgi:hypothetical protein